MFARKFNSDGMIVCPAPWRARNATCLPRSVPITYGPDGSPNGVEIRSSRRSVSSAISYRPLPPMIPIFVSIVSLVSAQRGDDPPLTLLFPDVPRRDLRIVLEEHQDVLLDRVPDEPL